MNIEDIKSWCEKHNAIQRTIDTFWDCFWYYKEEEPEEFETNFPKFCKENLVLYLGKVSYVINLPDFDQEFVTITIDFFYNEERTGWFRQEYLLSGEEFDEFFVID